MIINLIILEDIDKWLQRQLEFENIKYKVSVRDGKLLECKQTKRRTHKYNIHVSFLSGNYCKP